MNVALRVSTAVGAEDFHHVFGDEVVAVLIAESYQVLKWSFPGGKFTSILRCCATSYAAFDAYPTCCKTPLECSCHSKGRIEHRDGKRDTCILTWLAEDANLLYAVASESRTDPYWLNGHSANTSSSPMDEDAVAVALPNARFRSIGRCRSRRSGECSPLHDNTTTGRQCVYSDTISSTTCYDNSERISIYTERGDGREIFHSLGIATILLPIGDGVEMRCISNDCTGDALDAKPDDPISKCLEICACQ